MNFLSKIFGNYTKHSIEAFMYLPLSTLHQDLLTLSPVTDKNKDQVIENIRAITEEIIWSDQNSGDSFKYVIECNLFRLFWNLLAEVKFKEVHAQLIQTATMLIHNLSSTTCKSKTYVEYMLSTLFYREIVTYNFDFSDEELVELYMSMLKTFAINLKPDVFTEFVTSNSFNVLNSAIIFMNYHEPMIKTASRTVVLSIFSCTVHIARSKSVKSYVVKSGLFPSLVSSLSEKLSLCDRLILSNNQNKLEATLAELSEDLYFINDILELQIKEFNESLCNTLIKNLLFPIVISSLGSIQHSAHHLSIPLSGTLLYHLLKIVKNPALVNTITMGILSKSVPEELAGLLEEIPSPNLRSGDQYIEAAGRYLEQLEGFGRIEELAYNSVPEVIFSFLTSKDNNLIGTTLILIDTVISCASVSNNLLLAAGLIPFEKLKIKNLLSSILGRKDLNSEYNDSAIEAIINLLGYEHPLQLFLFKLACKVLISLTYRKDQTDCLSEEHRGRLNYAFLRSIQNLQEFLTDDMEYDLFFVAFQSEWKALSAPEPKISSLVHLLLPYNEELEGVPLEHRNPLDESEAMRCEIQRFFAIWSVKFSLCRDKSIFSLDIYPLYYLSNSVIWEKGKSYNMQNKNLVKCVVKLKKKEETLLYAGDADFFLLVAPDPKYEEFFLVKFVESLINVETMQDRADPRRLVLMVNSIGEPFEVVFTDPQQCLWTLREISGSTEACRERYIGLLTKLFVQLSSGAQFSY